MRIWADIYNAAGDRLGDGPIHTLTNAKVIHKLDGAGSISFDVPGADTRALDLIQPKRRARLFVLDEEGREPRELGRMIIEKVGAKASSSGWSRSADGPDDIAELKFTSVLRGRKYDSYQVGTVISSLVGLTSWIYSTGTATNVVSVRYDGVSVLKALQTLVANQGIHFRREPHPTTGEPMFAYGAFGDDSGLRVVNAAYLHPDVYDNDDVLLIDQLQLAENSEDLCNWLVPYGAGRGDAMLTLAKSTRTTPYTIQTMTGPDGQTLYYLSDATSIAAYGEVQKVGTFKDIGPISNSEADQVAAANALYDAAVAWLQRYKDPYVSYKLKVKKLRGTLNPGDKIRLRYKGVITDEAGNMVDFQDIDGDFWVLEVREGYGVGGVNITLKIASVDRYEQSEAQVVLGRLEEIRIGNVSVEPYFSKASYVYRREIDSTHSAVVPLDITDATADLVRCRLRIVTRPFRATAKSAQSVTSASGGGGSTTSASGGASTQTSAGGGAHRHRIAYHTTLTIPPVTNRNFVMRDASLNDAMMVIATATPTDLYTYDAASNHTHSISIPSHTHSVNIPSHSHTIPAADLDYGIVDDTDYPASLRISINGTDYTTGLGGPWDVGGTGANFVIEISDQVKASAGTLQQLHEIEITCDSGQGEVEVTIEPYEIIQSIAVL